MRHLKIGHDADVWTGPETWVNVTYLASSKVHAVLTSAVEMDGSCESNARLVWKVGEKCLQCWCGGQTLTLVQK